MVVVVVVAEKEGVHHQADRLGAWARAGWAEAPAGRDGREILLNEGGRVCGMASKTPMRLAAAFSRRMVSLWAKRRQSRLARAHCDRGVRLLVF